MPLATIAELHAALDERDQAFRWLDVAFDEKFSLPLRVFVDPTWERYSIHEDSRLAVLRMRVGRRLRLSNWSSPEKCRLKPASSRPELSRANPELKTTNSVSVGETLSTEPVLCAPTLPRNRSSHQHEHRSERPYDQDSLAAV